MKCRRGEKVTTVVNYFCRSNTQWKAGEGVFVHQSNFDPTGGRSPGHDEL